MVEEITDNMPSINKSVIRFSGQDWVQGAAPQYGDGVDSLPGMVGAGNTALKAIDPFRALGYILPAPLPESPTNANVISALLIAGVSGVESSVNYFYALEQGSKIHRLASLDYSITNAGSWPRTILGNGVTTGDDMIEYSVNIAGTREKCLFYSWNDGGAAWNIGRYRISNGTFDDDWLTTVPANAPTLSGNAKPHPMIRGANDILYVGDGNVMQGIDGANGTNGTYIAGSLTLPADYIITSFAKTDSFLVIFAYRSLIGATLAPDDFGGSQDATAFFWNYIDLDPTFVMPLNDDNVSGAFAYQSTIGCFTAGADASREVNGGNRTSRLRIFDGTQFTLVKQFTGNLPKYRGVQVVNDSIQWNSQGVVHCYGSPYAEVEAGLNLTYRGSGTSTGLYAIIGGSAGYPIASSGISTSGGLQRFQSGFTNSSLLLSEAANPQVDPGQMGLIKSVTVYFGATVTGGRTVTVSTVTDGTTVTTVLNAVSTINAGNLVSRYIFDTSGNELVRFSEVRVSVSYATGAGSTEAPAVRWIDVEYEPVTILSTEI